jgi:hypothetical protein
MNVLKLVFLPVIFISAFASGCIRRSATVPQMLAVKDQVSVQELVERINSYQQIKTLAAQVEIGVTDTFKGVQYTTANGALRLQRPAKIRMKIIAPVINSDVVDMTTDGQKFSLAIYRPKDKRMFVRGSNRVRSVGADELTQTTDPRLKEAGGLANIRPQHITEAFIIKPIIGDPNTEYFREEDVETEPDPRPKKSGHFVDRTYYVLYVMERVEGGELHVRRKFWFDRTQEGTPLVRQQIFDNGDAAAGSDITYSDFFYPPNSKWQLAQTVTITRRTDGYKMQILLVEKDSIEINSQLPPTTFVLENTEHMKELDLDESSELGTSKIVGQQRPGAK